jgi:hypothetical protein
MCLKLRSTANSTPLKSCFPYKVDSVTSGVRQFAGIRDGSATYFSRHDKTPDEDAEQEAIVLEVDVINDYEPGMQEKRECYYSLGAVIQAPTTQPEH